MKNRKSTGNKFIDLSTYGLVKNSPKEVTEEEQVKYETVDHIYNVKDNVNIFSSILRNRVEKHDESKLSEYELPYFTKYSPLLKTTEYMSSDYKSYLKEMKPGLDHHYASNQHHPEFYKNGINGMNLFDIIEMLMDWFASTQRTKDGDIYKSLELNAKRFQIPELLVNVMKRTMDAMKPCYLYIRDINDRDKTPIEITSDIAEEFIEKINTNEEIDLICNKKISSLIDEMVSQNITYKKVEFDGMLIVLQFTIYD